MAYLAVAAGGLIGAVLRYVISEWIGTAGGFPLATMLINLSGSFFLAWFYTYTFEKVQIHPHLRLGIGTGLVGAFTTYSTFTVDTWKLLQAGLRWTAFWYVLGSFALCLGAAVCGHRLARRQSRLRFTGEWDGEVPPR